MPTLTYGTFCGLDIEMAVTWSIFKLMFYTHCYTVNTVQSWPKVKITQYSAFINSGSVVKVYCVGVAEDVSQTSFCQ